MRRCDDARRKLAEAGHPVEFLEAQFLHQQSYASKPLERQSKKKGIKEIECILAVRSQLHAAQTVLHRLQDDLTNFPNDGTLASREALHDISSAIEKRALNVMRLEKQDSRMTERLQLGDPISFKQLKTMKKHAWFDHQLNMRALKSRIISKICERKMEISNISGACRSKAVDHQTAVHTDKAIKRRLQSVRTLVSKYNERQASMMKLRGKGPIPKTALVPPRLEMKGLFSLDVDQDIWLDIGIEDEASFGGDIPPWLGDDTVRRGISIMQELVSCEGELYRLRQERSALQASFAREHTALIQLIRRTTDVDVLHFLYIRVSNLERLGQGWRDRVDHLPTAWTPPSWPTPLDRAAVTGTHVSAGVSGPNVDRTSQASAWEGASSAAHNTRERARTSSTTVDLLDNSDLDIQSSDDEADLELEPHILTNAAVADLSNWLLERRPATSNIANAWDGESVSTLSSLKSWASVAGEVSSDNEQSEFVS